MEGIENAAGRLQAVEKADVSSPLDCIPAFVERITASHIDSLVTLSAGIQLVVQRLQKLADECVVCSEEALELAELTNGAGNVVTVSTLCRLISDDFASCAKNMARVVEDLGKAIFSEEPTSAVLRFYAVSRCGSF